MDYNTIATSLMPKQMQKVFNRQAMRGLEGASYGNWNPADDAAEAFAYQDPAYQNESIRSAAMAKQPNMTPWQQYSAVLGARGVGFPTGKPSSIADNPGSTWWTNQAGPRPWQEPALRGLKGGIS